MLILEQRAAWCQKWWHLVQGAWFSVDRTPFQPALLGFDRWGLLRPAVLAEEAALEWGITISRKGCQGLDLQVWLPPPSSPSPHPVITTTWNMLERMPGWPELTRGPALGGTKQGWSLRLVSCGFCLFF